MFAAVHSECMKTGGNRNCSLSSQYARLHFQGMCNSVIKNVRVSKVIVCVCKKN